MFFKEKYVQFYLDNHFLKKLFVRYPPRCLKLGLENLLILHLMYGISQVWYSITR
jgi:hypothetical protein